MLPSSQSVAGRILYWVAEQADAEPSLVGLYPQIKEGKHLEPMGERLQEEKIGFCSQTCPTSLTAVSQREVISILPVPSHLFYL